MLLGSNLESAYGRGPLMMYNWPGNFFEVLGNGTFGLGTYTSHDLQYVSSHMYDMHLKDYFNDSSVDTHVGGGRELVEGACFTHFCLGVVAGGRRPLGLEAQPPPKRG